MIIIIIQFPAPLTKEHLRKKSMNLKENNLCNSSYGIRQWVFRIKSLSNNSYLITTTYKSHIRHIKIDNIIIQVFYNTDMTH